MNMRGKKALSPVIATVLLIAIVIVIGLIVFLWFRGMTEEAITKFEGKNVKLVCDEVNLEASYSGGYVYVANTGNVPIYKIKAKITSQGAYSTEFLEIGWPETGLNQGGTYSGLISTTGEEMLLIPVLIGKTATGEKAYTCEESSGVYVSMD
jgi:flagellin-like protein